MQRRTGRVPRTPDVDAMIFAAGLGTRHFYRVRFAEGEPATLIARVEAESDSQPKSGEAEPPAWLPGPPLEPLRSFLETAGLPVPRSYAHLPEHGIDLLEDVGDRTLKDANESARNQLYREACSLIPRLQQLSAQPSSVPAFGRTFDRTLVETKAWKWLNWTLPGLLDRRASPEETVAVEAAFSRISDLLEEAPRRLAHRDFKAENLHLVARAKGQESATERLVMIDIQGAFMAPPEYDLVCLLYDLQVDLDEAFMQHAFRETLPELPDSPDLEVATLRFDAIATIRLCKDISHLVHAARARNDLRRWHEIPRGLALLERATGRLGHTLPEIRALTSVIQVLTETVRSSDSASQRGPR
jgi:aminoglycoside/choline kinase family phosphotransferase